MRGRLTRLFILSVFLSAFSYQNLVGQANSIFDNLTKKEQKEIKIQIKAMSLEDKILAFTCLDYNNISGLNKEIAGIVLNDGSKNIRGQFSTEDWITFFNISSVQKFNSTPFPSFKVRKSSKIENPQWLPGIFNADYTLDVEPNTTGNIFYGLDTIGVEAIISPYSSWDSLISATIKHDLLYFPTTYENIVKYGDVKTGSRKLRKQLDEKLRIKIASEKKITTKALIADVVTKDIYQWIWGVYNASIQNENSSQNFSVNRLDTTNICSFSFNPTNFEEFNKVLRRYAPMQHYQSSPDFKFDIDRLSTYDIIIIPISEFDEEKEAFIHLASNNSKILLVDFGEQLNSTSTNLLNQKNITIVSIPEDNWLTQSIAAQSIFGVNKNEKDNTTLGYGIPELVGLNPDSLARIDDIVTQAITKMATPGCQVLIAKDGYVIWDKAYGYQTYDSLKPINENTLFDLASITKVLATTQAMMYLLDQGKIDLDVPLSSYQPYLAGTNKKNITSRQVLAHQAGLYPYYPFWKKIIDEMPEVEGKDVKTIQVGRSLWVSPHVADSILIWAAKSDLLVDRIDTITHKQYLYSDIGFYLLKDLIEKKTGKRLDNFLTEKLYKPMGTTLRFKPTCYFSTENIAPTEVDENLRHEVLQGFVHDRNAALMGGVAGQAGLFGNANDIAKILQLQLNGGSYAGKRYFTSSTVKQFLSRQYDNNRRALGWDKPGTEPDGPVSTLASIETFGHSGFTGGSIWADPKENIIFVFLSNRVYPSAENTKLIEMNIRTRIQDIVYRSIIKSE